MFGGKRGVPVGSRHGQQRSLRRDSSPPRAAKPSSSSQAPNFNSIKLHTFSHKELFRPHSVNTALFAPPQSSAQLTAHTGYSIQQPSR